MYVMTQCFCGSLYHSISENIFDLVNQALDGRDIWVTHKGHRFRIVPDTPAGSRLGRITPLEVINPEFPELNDSSLLAEMTRAWEKDWADIW